MYKNNEREVEMLSHPVIMNIGLKAEISETQPGMLQLIGFNHRYQLQTPIAVV